MTQPTEIRTGWGSRVAQLCMALLLFEGISGLAITLSPFHATGSGHSGVDQPACQFAANGYGLPQAPISAGQSPDRYGHSASFYLQFNEIPGQDDGGFLEVGLPQEITGLEIPNSTGSPQT